MEQCRPRRTRVLPAHLRGFWVEGVCELSQLAAAVRLDHTYSCISAQDQTPNVVKKRFLKNAAVLPDVRPAVSVSSVDVCQQEESVSIHGCSVEAYQDIYRSVAEPMIKTRCGRRCPYSLELGLKVKQGLWETLNRPSLVETEQPGGRVLIAERFNTSSSKRSAPRIHVDISEELLPQEPRPKRRRH